MLRTIRKDSKPGNLAPGTIPPADKNSQDDTGGLSFFCAFVFVFRSSYRLEVVCLICVFVFVCLFVFVFVVMSSYRLEVVCLPRLNKLQLHSA